MTFICKPFPLMHTNSSFNREWSLANQMSSFFSAITWTHRHSQTQWCQLGDLVARSGNFPDPLSNLNEQQRLPRAHPSLRAVCGSVAVYKPRAQHSRAVKWIANAQGCTTEITLWFKFDILPRISIKKVGLLKELKSWGCFEKEDISMVQVKANDSNPRNLHSQSAPRGVCAVILG